MQQKKKKIINEAISLHREMDLFCGNIIEKKIRREKRCFGCDGAVLRVSVTIRKGRNTKRKTMWSVSRKVTKHKGYMQTHSRYESVELNEVE